MNEPKPAVVRPRVVVGDQGVVLLEDEVLARIERGATGLIVLVGKRSSGRSTALAHLASVLGDEPGVLLVDGPPDSVLAAVDTRLVICTVPVNTVAREVWRLAPWSRDDCIEYVLEAHRERCASIMRRAAADTYDLTGLPDLWRPVLDRLAEDESLVGVRAALLREIEARLPEARARKIGRECCFTLVCHPEQENKQELLLKATRRIGEDAMRLLRHEPARVLLAADYLCDKLRSGACKLLAEPFPRVLVDEAARQLCGEQRVIGQLHDVVRGRRREQQPMAASLLHAADADWLPQRDGATFVSGAYLSGVRWAGIQLKSLNLCGADLSGADLSEARLQEVVARRANLSGANLHGARLGRLSADNANLAGADLTFARAPSADFCLADLGDANLEGALLRNASFLRANLSGARLARANLVAANFAGATLDDADFAGANLASARLGELPLKRASFAGAQFDHAFLGRADMEDMALPGASFVGADLQEAALTGSRIPGGHFRGANLRAARLADIEWQRADLRDADLSQCTFHLGSSRSGLVGSPIASEGSRTGFYTDEYHEQGFKAPEEIRKANLRGADLRGAKIEHTDFYLVDLRDALYTSEQEEVFRRCRAILESRV